MMALGDSMAEQNNSDPAVSTPASDTPNAAPLTDMVLTPFSAKGNRMENTIT